MNKFKFKSYINSISTTDEVISQMLQLDDELQSSNLRNLRAFNKTYYIITKNVVEKVNQNFFDNNELMSLFDVHFAQYYFDALKEYCDIGITTPAWQKCFEDCEKNKHFKFLYMTLGINAHVNNDIPLVLNDLMITNIYKDDYDKVNKIIFDSIDEVIFYLEEANSIVEYVEMNTLFLYKLFLGFIIQNWRVNGWRNFTLLQKGSISKKDISDHALNISEEIIETGNYNLLQTPKAYKDFLLGNTFNNIF